MWTTSHDWEGGWYEHKGYMVPPLSIEGLREFNLVQQGRNSLILHNFSIPPCAKYGLPTSTLLWSFVSVCYLGGPRGSQTREYEGIEKVWGCLTTRLLPKQGLLAPFVGLVDFVDRGFSNFRDHHMSDRVGIRGKMNTQDECTRRVRTYIHKCSYSFMRRRGAWACPNSPSSQDGRT